MNARQLKNSILQLAVQGKLVPQDPNDEPASVLLERIRAEKQKLIKEGKIKKDKNESVIYRAPREGGGSADNLPYAFYERTADGAVRDITDELPFDIPEKWEWVRLGILAETITSGSRDWAKYYAIDGAKFLRMGNLSRNSFDLKCADIQYVRLPEKTEGTRTSLIVDDLLFSITGEVGLMGLIPANFGEAYINQHTAMIRFLSVIRGSFLPFVLLTDYAQKKYKKSQHVKRQVK